jgi:hypothetical protein
MRERNWLNYNKELVQRGSLTFLIDSKTFRNLKHVSKSKSAGRPQEFSNLLIQLLATIKTHFKMTYRFLEGFSKSFLTRLIPNVKLPTYSLICKRLVKIGALLPPLSPCRSSSVILDATGMKVIGEGEWKVKMHGRSRRRKWIKIHLGIDAVTQEIVAEITSESSVGDSKMTEPLLNQISGRIKQVMGDGGYDKEEAREAIRRRKAKGIIPPPRNARYKGNNNERDKAILEIEGLGNNLEGRSLWGKLTGYNRRVLIETAMSRLKRLFGDRFYSKSIERQRVESRMRCLIINRMKTN